MRLYLDNSLVPKSWDDTGGVAVLCVLAKHEEEALAGDQRRRPVVASRVHHVVTFHLRFDYYLSSGNGCYTIWLNHDGRGGIDLRLV